MGRKKSMNGGVRSLGDDTKDCSICRKQFIPGVEGATSNMCAECAQTENNSGNISLSKVHVFNLEQYVEGPLGMLGSRWKDFMIKIIQRPGEEWKIHFGDRDIYPVKDFEFRNQNLQATRKREINGEQNKRVIILQRTGMENLGYLGRWVVMARNPEKLTKLKNTLREAGAVDKTQSTTEEISSVPDSTTQLDNEDDELSRPYSDGSGQAGGKKKSKKRKSKKRKSTKKSKSKKRKTQNRKSSKKRKSTKRR